MLDRAALTFCLADAFHPGCEMTWPVRHASMYSAPFRIRHRRPDDLEPSFGPTLTPAAASPSADRCTPRPPAGSRGGWQCPGRPTRQAAGPATTRCMTSIYPRSGPRVPNDVLTIEDYLTAVDPTNPADEREAAFQRRAIWLRGLGPTDTIAEYYTAINNMVVDFGKLGVVEARPGVKGDDAFPPVMLVESQPDLAAAPHFQGRAMPQADESEALVVTKVHRFPHGIRHGGSGLI